MNVPDRGDIVVVDSDPQAGHEQMKRRPALVLSPDSFNRVFGLAFVAPVTSNPKGHAFEIALPVESGVTGSVMTHQLKSLDWKVRRAKKVGVASAEILESAAEIVREIVS